jgi:hypothetical protein
VVLNSLAADVELRGHLGVRESLGDQVWTANGSGHKREVFTFGPELDLCPLI